MLILLCGLVLFFGVHSIGLAAPSWRDGAIARLGPHLWRGLYSLVALVGLVLLVRGYGEARQAPQVLWVVPGSYRQVVALLMLPVFPALLATYLPGRIRAILKHPMLVAVKLWSFVHLLVVGTLAGVLLFGTTLVWAVLTRMSLKHRAVARPTPQLAESPWNDALALIVGLALYAFMVLAGHRWLIGVSPFGGS